MKQTTRRIFGATLALTVMLAVAPVYAQTGQGMMAGEGGQGQGSGAPQLSSIMHDMAGQMMEMSGSLSKGNMSTGMQKQEGQRMHEMSTMMDKMSGMMGKGLMMDADTQMQMDQMRARMNQMMKEGMKPTK
jgi:hypothetical protein